MAQLDWFLVWEISMDMLAEILMDLQLVEALLNETRRVLLECCDEKHLCFVNNNNNNGYF